MDKILFEIRKFLYKRRRDLNFMIITACSIVLFLIVTVVYFTAYEPLKSNFANQMNTIYLYTNNVSRLRELQTSADIMNKKLNEIDVVYNNLNKIVPGKRNIPYVTSQISLAADNNKVLIGDMTKGIEKAVKVGADEFGVVQYKITGFGTYENTVSFLYALETSNGIFAIDKFKIEPLSDEEKEKYSDPSLVKTSLTINIYMKAT